MRGSRVPVCRREMSEGQQPLGVVRRSRTTVSVGLSLRRFADDGNEHFSAGLRSPAGEGGQRKPVHGAWPDSLTSMGPVLRQKSVKYVRRRVKLQPPGARSRPPYLAFTRRYTCLSVGLDP